MKIYIGADHRGFSGKQDLLAWLPVQGFEVQDCGAAEYDQQDDFPDFGFAVGQAVAADPNSRGIVLCGGGMGILIAANKVAGVRAGLAASPEIIRLARHDDDINVLAIPSDLVSTDEMHELVMTFLQTEFPDEERYRRRIGRIASYEQK